MDTVSLKEIRFFAKNRISGGVELNFFDPQKQLNHSCLEVK